MSANLAPERRASPATHIHPSFHGALFAIPSRLVKVRHLLRDLHVSAAGWGCRLLFDPLRLGTTPAAAHVVEVVFSLRRRTKYIELMSQRQLTLRGKAHSTFARSHVRTFAPSLPVAVTGILGNQRLKSSHISSELRAFERHHGRMPGDSDPRTISRAISTDVPVTLAYWAAPSAQFIISLRRCLGNYVSMFLSSGGWCVSADRELSSRIPSLRKACRTAQAQSHGILLR